MRFSAYLTPLESADIFIKEVMRLNYCNTLANTFPGQAECVLMFGGAMLPGADWEMKND